VADGEREESIGDLVGRLATDARAYAEAEVGYYRALALQKGREAQAGFFLAIAALLVAIAAFVALPVGLILVLAPLVGPLWATLIVVALFLTLTGGLGLLAYMHLRKVFSK